MFTSGYGPFGGYMDVDNDRDEMLIMNVSSLHGASIPRPSRGIKGCDESWLNSNIPQDMIKILGKYKDRKWLRHSQHNYCIFYACDIMGGLCGLSKEACMKLLNQPTFIDSLLSLWTGGLTWFEQRAAARTLGTIFLTTSCAIPMFMENKYNINLFQEAMKQYTESVQYVIKRCMVNPDRWKSGEEYVQDLVLKVKGRSMQYGEDISRECVKHCAQDWMTYNGCILLHLAKYANENDDLMKLFQCLDMSLIEKTCAMDLCYQFFLQNPDRYPDTFMDALIHLTNNKIICQMISSNENIMKSIILKLRSRSTLHLRYDLIASNLLKNDCVSQKYYYDLCVSLITLLDINKTYNGIDKCFENYDYYHLFDSIVDSLKLLFNISKSSDLQIEFMESNKTMARFKCRACCKLVRFPQKIPCGHIYCYLCIIHKLKTDDKNAKCLVNKCTNKNFIFTAKEDKINVKILNAMHTLKIKAKLNTANNKDVYIGPLNEYWSFIKQNLMLDTKIMTDFKLYNEFVYFCDFMIKETYIKMNKDLKQLRIDGRNKKNKGNNLFKNQQYNKAIDCYIKALELCPNRYKEDRIVYFSNLAIAYFKTNQIFNAYKTALLGLAINSHHCKLSHILSECYSKTNISQLTKNIVNIKSFNVSNDNLFINKVHNVMLFKFHTRFKSNYFGTKHKHRNEEFKNMTGSDRDKAVMELFEEEQKDPFTKSIAEKQEECLKHKIRFVRDYYKKYFEEYMEFKQQRQRAKKEIYAFLIHILSNKTKFWIYENDEELENEEFVAICDLMEIVSDHFNLEKQLDSIAPLKQNVLINSFIAKNCLGFNECKIGQNLLIPDVIVELVQNLIFKKPKYNIYNVDAWCIRQMVKKSNYLTESEERLYDGYDTAFYGLKLTDKTKTLDDKWRGQDFSDNDSGIEEFYSK